MTAIVAELMEMGDYAPDDPGFFVLDVAFSKDVAFSIEGAWEYEAEDWFMPYIYISVTLPNGEVIDVDPKYNLQDDDRPVGPFLAQQLLEHCYITDWKWE